MAVAAFHVPGASARWGGIAPGGNGGNWGLTGQSKGGDGGGTTGADGQAGTLTKRTVGP